MNIKYSEEQEKELEEGYKSAQTPEERDDFILKYMGNHHKSKKSVISKLSKMGIYIPKQKISKVTGGKPETKEKMVHDIAMQLGFNPEDLAGLEKAHKLVLMKLRDRLTNRESP